MQLRAMPSSVKFMSKIFSPTSRYAAQRGVDSALCHIAGSHDSMLCCIARSRDSAAMRHSLESTYIRKYLRDSQPCKNIVTC
jgi:hypothetical protein